MQMASAALLREGDVIVVISKSGKAPELLRVIEVAMQAGARVIAITSSNTPLSKRATISLETDHIEIRETQLSMLSRVLHLVMIDILAVGVAMRRASPAGALMQPASEGHGSSEDDLGGNSRDRPAQEILEWLSHGVAPLPERYRGKA